MTRRRHLRAWALVALGGALVLGMAARPGAQAPAASTAPKKIIFLSGPKDHGQPGRHEYEKDLRILATALDTAPNLKGVKTEVYVGKAPTDLNVYADAAAIVLESSSDRDARETHPLFPPEPETTKHTYDQPTLDFLKGLDARVKAGMGVVVLHYANWVEHWVARRYYLDWTGGLWVQGLSRNPVDQWAMSMPNPAHPILRGVKPWSYRDEVFCRFALPIDLKRTDLLIGTPAKAPTGAQVASWAYEREGGGRAFVMGGVDFHDNMGLVDDFRKFLLNGIAWAAGLEVPANGVQSATPVVPPTPAPPSGAAAPSSRP
jgi:type 1 glutamine amidotransferase